MWQFDCGLEPVISQELVDCLSRTGLERPLMETWELSKYRFDEPLEMFFPKYENILMSCVHIQIMQRANWKPEIFLKLFLCAKAWWSRDADELTSEARFILDAVQII